jgi:hypothetical protein
MAASNNNVPHLFASDSAPQGRTHTGQIIASALAAALLAGACATVPAGNAPSVAVLPGGGKDMASFNKDDIACRGDAHARANDNTPLPTAMGLGGRTEVASTRGRLALRDSTDTTTGSVYGGAPAANAGTFTVQQRYDTAYVQCMFSKGHKIPVNEAMSS